MVPETKKSAHLQEVERDAIRIQTKRFKDQEDERQYQIAKRQEEEQSSEAVETKEGNK